jgi:hypothetical protein
MIIDIYCLPSVPGSNLTHFPYNILHHSQIDKMWSIPHFTEDETKAQS